MKIRLIKSIVVAASLLVAVSANALSLIGDKEEPLLEASDAFQTQVALNDDTLNVEINIAPGYFLYRSKISVSSENAEFGTLKLPDGVKKDDQFFGKVETYRGLMNYSAPLINSAVTGPLKIKVVSQGCADVGICYPPYSEEFTVNVVNAVSTQADTQEPVNALQQSYEAQAQQDTAPTNGLGIIPIESDGLSASPLPSSAAPAGGGGSTLGDQLRMDDDNEVLDPEVAFTMMPNSIVNGVASINWNIEEGHYLYKKRFSFELISPNTASLGESKMAEGVWEDDAFFGKSEVYRGETTVDLPISLPENTTDAVVRIGYQGCADIGICYPPIFKEVNLVEIAAVAAADGNSAGSQSGGNALASTTSPSDTSSQATEQVLSQVNAQNAAPIQSEQDRLADSLANNNRWVTIAIFFGAGLLLTFTPCVLPMIPILSSIIVGKGEKISTGRAFTLSLIYVLAMALTYTIAGVLIGLSGENIQATLQHPYVLTAFAFLFVVLSFSMFGYYELQMPTSIQNRLSKVSNNQKSGSFGGVATMGFLSALIVGPCVTAPLVGALIYIGQTGDAVLGGAALFALAMGMGLPLLIIGTAFGKYLPQAGAWMDTTKAIFGVMLLGLAIYMLDRVIPTWATMLLSALLLITVAMFMGVFESLPADARGWRRVSKGLGFAGLVYGTLLMIGVATGTGTLFRPMQGLSLAGNGAAGTAAEHVTFQKVKSIDQLNARLAEARASNTPVMFDFYADWCISCKEMEAFTFTDQKIAAKMKEGLLLQADVTANDDQDKALLKEFGIFGPPAIIFYDANGVEQKNARVVGYMPADEFGTILDRVF